VAFPLRMARRSRAEVKHGVEEALGLVRLAELAGRYPSELSGGQRQRVAVARALVNRPRLLLLDEPLAALDLKLREQMQLELINLQKRIGITFIYVTHDQGEALALSDRVAVMREGAIEQVGDPADVYEFPATRFVADFIGTCNLLDCRVDSVLRGYLQVEIDGLGALWVAQGAAVDVGANGALAVRPEKVRMDARIDATADENHLSGVVRDQLYLGDVTVYRIRLDNGAIFEAMRPNSAARGDRFFDVGDAVQVAWRRDAGRFLPL
jgi:spermidine/putrescine transport system ATP-binding protein